MTFEKEGKNLHTEEKLWEKSERCLIGTVEPLLYSHVPYHNDTIIKQTQEDFFRKIYTSHFICKGTKGLLKVCVWEGAGHRTETVIFWPHYYDRQRCVCLVLLMLGSTLLGAGFLYCILSASSLDPNSSGPQAPLVWCGFPYHTRLQLYCNCPWLPSCLRYIIIQRPHDRPLDLWNRMFNRHQAEITVMQFTGHSLPVHQSMSVRWEFFSSSHFISQFPPTWFPLIRMCHLLPVHHLGMASPWNDIFGRVKRSK